MTSLTAMFIDLFNANRILVISIIAGVIIFTAAVVIIVRMKRNKN